MTKVDKSLDFKVTSSVASCGTPSGAWHGRCMAQRMAQRMALHCANGDQQEGCKPKLIQHVLSWIPQLAVSLWVFGCLEYNEYHSWLFPCCGAGSSFGTLFLQVLNFSGVYSYVHLVKLFFRRCISLTAEQKDQGREPQATSDPKSDWEIQVTNLYNVNPGLIWITVITPKSVSLTWHHLSILK